MKTFCEFVLEDFLLCLHLKIFCEFTLEDLFFSLHFNICLEKISCSFKLFALCHVSLENTKRWMYFLDQAFTSYSLSHLGHSRWLTIGTSMRTLLAGVALGLHRLHAVTLAVLLVASYYIWRIQQINSCHDSVCNHCRGEKEKA